jgi:hypothetical protein
MRRLLFSLLAMCLLSVNVGCRSTTHGICDCTSDFDEPCTWRAPWLNESKAAPHPAGTPVAPEIREKEVLPAPAKKL